MLVDHKVINLQVLRKYLQCWISTGIENASNRLASAVCIIRLSQIYKINLSYDNTSTVLMALQVQVAIDEDGKPSCTYNTSTVNRLITTSEG